MKKKFWKFMRFFGIKPKAKKSEIVGKVINFGYNEAGQAIAVLHIEDGNLYDLIYTYTKNKNIVGFTINADEKPEE